MNRPTLDTVSVTPPSFGKNWASLVSQFKTAFRAIPHARFYALNEASTRAGVALERTIWSTLLAAGKRDENAVQRVLERIVPLIPNVRQSWRPPAELSPPPPWKHPLTGAPLPNPFDKPEDFLGQKILRERDPRRAELSERAAKAESPYELVAQLADEAVEREKIRRLEFGIKEYEANIFRRDQNEPGVLQAQNDFAEGHSEAVVEIWRFEAAPVIWPWQEDGNQTWLGRCINALKESPVDDVLDGNVLVDAFKLNRDLLDAQRQAAIDEADRAQARAEALRK